MSQSTSSPSIIHLAEKPGDNSPCRYIRVLPVRYAMSSDFPTPVEEKYASFITSHCRAKVQQHSHYTLRLLRIDSYVHMYIPGYPATRHVWKVGEGGTLKKIGTSAAPDTLLGMGGGKNPAFTYMLELPRLETPVWMAVTDGEWDEEVWQRVEENPELRMQNIVPATGESPAQSLVFPTADAAELVEEFRRQPGYLRALHEFKELHHLFDPDVSHLDLGGEDEAYTSDLVEHRWRWSSEKFEWKHVPPKKSENSQTDAANFYAALATATCPHHAVALADSAGLAMDGSRLNAVAAHACDDFMAWYGDAVALARFYNTYERRADFTSMQKNKGPYGRTSRTDCRRLADAFDQAWDFMAPFVRWHYVFWVDTLIGRGAWAFDQVMEDYALDIPHPVRGDAAQKLFARCVATLTTTSAECRWVYEAITRGSLSHLVKMTIKVLRAYIPDQESLSQDIESDTRQTLDLLCAAFSGLFHLYEPGGGLHPATKEILSAVIDALLPYYTPVSEADAEKDSRRLALEEMQKLEPDDKIRLNDENGNMYFSPFNTCWKFSNKSVPTGEGADVSAGLRDTLTVNGMNDLISMEALKPLEDKFGLVTPGTLTDRKVIEVNIHAIASVKQSLIILKGALAGLSAWDAVIKLKNSNSSLEWTLNAMAAFSSVVTLAEQVVSRIDTGLSQQYSLVRGKLRRPGNPVFKASANKVRISIKRQYDKFFEDLIQAPKWQKFLLVGRIAGNVVLLADAGVQLKRGNNHLAVGDILIYIGLNHVCRINMAGGIILIGFGVFLQFYGPITRIQYRLQQGYFGEKCGLSFDERPEKLEFGWLVTSFSYKKGQTPPDNVEIKPTSSIWEARHKHTIRDIGKCILMELVPFAEIALSEDGQRLEMHIMVPHVQSDSYIKLLKVTDITGGSYNDITEPFASQKCRVGLRNGVPCWSYSVPRGAVRFQTIDDPCGISFEKRHVYQLAIDVRLFYSGNADLPALDTQLMAEDITFETSQAWPSKKPLRPRIPRVNQVHRITAEMEIKHAMVLSGCGVGYPFPILSRR